ncbi:Hypothetical_protein [Hexamita inflata]|uniref:Hypothetical_protein n=1 Tax=Hexamita inflata TaxID=28002 RepID=A0AA86RER9_9EUKA|nr:Hypothetical protein HINF_LOCUS59302 [Hexamita inflata]
MAREIIISQNSGKPPHKPENIQKVSVSVETPHNKEAQTVMEPEKEAIPELQVVPKSADGKDEFQQPNKLEPPPFELPKAENMELCDFPKEKMHVLIDTICGHGCKTTTRKFEEIPTNPLNNVDLVQTQRECIFVSKQEIAMEMEKIQHAIKSRNLHIKCPVPNCKYSFSQVYDLMCHFQDNYKSHDIKLIPNIREMIVKELDSHNLKNQKFNHYLLCINCQCPFRDLKAAITHQQKCIFYHEIVRATDKQNTPQDNEGGEANNQSGEKRKPGRPKTSAKGNNNSKNPNTYNPPNNPSSNNNGNNDNPTIIYSSTAKSSKCSVHELSKYSNAEDELAIRERAEEIILKFVHAPPALMDDFLYIYLRTFHTTSKLSKWLRRDRVSDQVSNRRLYYVLHQPQPIWSSVITH